MDYSTKNNCDYKVSLVIANKESAYGITRAQKMGIETKVRLFVYFSIGLNVEQKYFKFSLKIVL